MIPLHLRPRIYDAPFSLPSTHQILHIGTDAIKTTSDDPARPSSPPGVRVTHSGCSHIFLTLYYHPSSLLAGKKIERGLNRSYPSGDPIFNNTIYLRQTLGLDQNLFFSHGTMEGPAGGSLAEPYHRARESRWGKGRAR